MPPFDELYDWVSGGRVWERQPSKAVPSFARVPGGGITMGPLVLPLAEERPNDWTPSEAENVRAFFATANRCGFVVITHVDPDLPLILLEARKLAGAAHV